MTFHVPFNQRESRRNHREPVYIGFEAPARPRTRFNWWGFNGMWMSFASLMSAGFLSIVPLIISYIGLRRPGKKMATVGTVVSLFGVVMAGTIVLSAVGSHRAESYRHEQAIYQKQLGYEIRQANKMIEQANVDLIEYRDANEGFLPGDIEGNVMVVGYVDPWGESLLFEPGNETCLIRSAGPDQEFMSNDDLVKKVKGKSTSMIKHVPVD